MSLRSVCTAPHAVLHAKAVPVHLGAGGVRQLAHDLIETMHAHDGVGLAAPQVGVSLQLFVANPSQQRGKELVIVNPTLQATKGRAAIVEGCLSLPDVWKRMSRAARVWMSGYDLSGAPLEVEAKGLLAIILQHEWDHLQGLLLTDRSHKSASQNTARAALRAPRGQRPGATTRTYQPWRYVEEERRWR